MKNVPPQKVERCRIDGPPTSMNGAAVIPYGPVMLRVLFSDGMGWDHVSVSLPNRCPSWDEMNYIKRLFFKPDETVVQFHPPESDYVNIHPYCLHLWRPQSARVPLPPTACV